MEEIEPRILLAALTALPALHSRPAAAKKLFIDFNGDAARSWLTYSVPATPAFDKDHDPSTFSASELSDISEIWGRVAEKYSPFNLDVTTVDPGNRSPGLTMQIVVGGDGKWLSDQGGGEAGGITPVGGFASGPATGFVFSGIFFNDKSIAEAVAHEAGHGFGLEHQSTFNSNGTLNQEYNSGTSEVAPIMGNSYTATRGIWFNGKNHNGVFQDDLSILAGSANGFGYRPDDWANVSSAADLPHSGTATSVSGVIEKTSDTDAWKFAIAAGHISFTVTEPLGGMLDATLTLRNESGAVVAQSATSSLGETLSANVPNGRYSIAVSSAGHYGDIGQYTLTGTLPAGVFSQPVVVTSGAGNDVITVTLIGSRYAVNVDGTLTNYTAAGVNGFNIYSGDGDDKITLGDGVVASYIFAGAGRDTIFGGQFNDSITGGAGNDLIYGNAGDDRLNGGNHSDTLIGGPGRDRLYGNAGNDVLKGGSNADRLYGGDDNDVLVGEGSSNKLFGEAGDDILVGGDSTDYINGGDGRDQLYGGGGDDFLYTSLDSSIDSVDGGAGTDHWQRDANDIGVNVEDIT